MTRAIQALNLPDCARAQIVAALPRVVPVDPRRLCVDETYQRGLSERSVRLSARIVAGWDWARFKPPLTLVVIAFGYFAGTRLAKAAEWWPGNGER